MPIEIQQYPSPAKNGDLVQFTFKNQVTAYAIGISFFNITYGTYDHWIQSLIIKFLPAQNIAVASNQVNAIVQIVMQDDSGHSANQADSYIYPVCIAVTGSPLDDTLIGSAIGIASGSFQNVKLPTQRSGYTIATCFQSGFNLSFTKDDHELLQANAGCALNYAGQSGQILASANLRNDTGDQVQIATVDAGYIVSSYTNPGMGVAEIKNQTGDQITVPLMAGMDSVSAVAVFIRSWNLQYQSVHYVHEIQIGSWKPPTIHREASGKVSSVTIPNLYADINDCSGHTQDMSSSYCDALVIAVP